MLLRMWFNWLCCFIVYLIVYLAVGLQVCIRSLMFTKVLPASFHECTHLHSVGQKIESHCSGQVYLEDSIMVEPLSWTPLERRDHLHFYARGTILIEIERFHSIKAIIILWLT